MAPPASGIMTAHRSILPACRSAQKQRARLARWCVRFQRSFETEIKLEAFDAEGRAIARTVKAELLTWSIVYFDEAAAAPASTSQRRPTRSRSHDRSTTRRVCPR